MNAPVEQLVTDVKVLATDVEELLKSTAATSGEKLAAARARAQAALTKAKDAVQISARQATEAADRYVNEKPWPAIGIAAAIGVLVGFIVGRR